MSENRLNTAQKHLFLERCEDSVKRNHGRMTMARKVVFETLASADGPLGAYDVLERAKKKTGHIDVSTIYRNLEFLAAEGLIHEFGHEGWVACSHLESTCGSLHVLLKCQSCAFKEETCIADPQAFAKSLQQQAGKENLKPTAAVIIGLCKDCQSRTNERARHSH